MRNTPKKKTTLAQRLAQESKNAYGRFELPAEALKDVDEARALYNAGHRITMRALVEALRAEYKLTTKYDTISRCIREHLGISRW